MSSGTALDRAFGLIRDVPDYPNPGVLFRDITPLLADAVAFRAVIEALAEPVRAAGAGLVVGVEARGFLLGAAVALAAGTGVVPVRKAGKLPVVAASRDYQLEYGSATLELPAGAIDPGARAYLVDDVLATGGTLRASCELVADAGGEVVGAGVLLELTALAGRDRLPGVDPHVLMRG
ncbi:adenine phosphoribosyltransferase [Pseudonocardia eucalypti]|uniref:Adenine phosphoribosyltransferase n=1 Tax=Pseudonocardia eucalypti TaxID=648755 RepID=A0ABP9QSZ0_9PSEU|nr:adenine phosphoribosyltransferase [Pseudonocardia eucalypti]